MLFNRRRNRSDTGSDDQTRRSTIGRRLITLSITMIATTVITVSVGRWFATNLEKQFDKIFKDAEMEFTINEMHALVLTMLSETREYVLLGEDESLEELQETEEAIQAIMLSFVSENADIAEEMSVFDAELQQRFERAVQGILESSAEVVSVRTLGATQDELEEALAEMEEAESIFDGAIQAFKSRVTEVVEEGAAIILTSIWGLRAFWTFLFIAVVVLSTGGVYLIWRSIVYPIQKLDETVLRMTEGDWSIQAEVTGPDEIGELATSFNTMVAQLRTALREAEDRSTDLARRARYLEATSDVSRYAVAELDMQELLSRAVMLISERFGFYHAGIFLIDTSGEWAELQAASSEGGQRMLARGHRLRIGQTGTVGFVTSQGEPRIALDVEADARFFDNPDLPDTRSAMTLPLRARGRIIGALDVQSKSRGAFTSDDIAVLQNLADQVALAISNARLFERLQESVAAERMAYGELSRRAWSEMLHARHNIGYVDRSDGTVPTADDVPPVMLQASKEKTLVKADDLTVAIPLRIREGDDVLGVARLRKPAESGAWTQEQIALVQSIAEQTSVALERARLYQDSRRSAMQERLVGEATVRMRQDLDVESVLKTAADEIYQALELEEVVVRLVGDTEGGQD